MCRAMSHREGENNTLVYVIKLGIEKIEEMKEFKYLAIVLPEYAGMEREIKQSAVMASYRHPK